MENFIIPKGRSFLLTVGEYSNFYNLVLCTALEDINILELREEYKILFPKKDNYYFEKEEFVNWLVINKGLASYVDCMEWWLGSYGELNFSLGEL